MSVHIKQKQTGGGSSSVSFKFLVLGDQYVGKTSVLERYVNNQFKSNYLVTIGMDKRFKRLEVNSTNIDIFITDTAGEERFRSLTKMFYKGADGILLGFSLTEPKTLESVNYWVDQIYQNNGKNQNVSIVLFGNKSDDVQNIKVTKDEIDKIKEKYNLEYFETSAKENHNIKEVFEYLTKMTIKNKGFLEKIGLGPEASFNEIIIKEKENQKLEATYNPNANRKKKKCC